MSTPSAAPVTARSQVRRRGLMLVLSSPSGAGKSTISKRMLALDANLSMSVSVTTRPMRPGEVDGKDYYFIDKAAFEARVARGELLEHAQVFTNYYGTPKGPVEDALRAGRDVLFDIDWQGTQQLSESAGDDLVRIFILPPSAAELERRLTNRGQDTAEVIAHRMAKANDEMSHWSEYDYVIVNEDVEVSVAAVQAILTAERLKRRRQVGLTEFVRALQVGQG
ncbi:MULTISPECIES: guanylate kinase [Azospirillaceae]|uniref:guanylate kinase n=1 Tax=Azospirillaceae TaxID=2829815 RepID=UPI000B6C30D1|nr:MULTISPECIES: guanylate kinase [Azospirillaceae]MDG5495159.1 guanylate kinase [Niveispirillum sp. BGYR6]SNS40380.1 guanylate kinase [Azospirillum sp. RU38E]SNS58905.1 guanylate kinase [Azospirillum sp. RU37A]